MTAGYIGGMMGDAEAFERAVRANPGDRTAQLVYADWCDENGDPAFAAALRDEAFPGVARLAVKKGWSLRIAWTLFAGCKAMAEAGKVAAGQLAKPIQLLGAALQANAEVMTRLGAAIARANQTGR